MECILFNSNDAVENYIDQCIHIKGWERFQDLPETDKENLLAAMLDDTGFDSYEIIFESGMDITSAVRDLITGMMNPEQFKLNLIAALKNTYSERLDEIFEQRIYLLKIDAKEANFKYTNEMLENIFFNRESVL